LTNAFPDHHIGRHARRDNRHVLLRSSRFGIHISRWRVVRVPMGDEMRKDGCAMTHQEASKILTRNFPGKRINIACNVWTLEDGWPQEPCFYICVYDANGAGQNKNGSGVSLQAALTQTMAVSDPQEADAMFTTKKGLAR
jgi:hypothetical protein